MFPAISPIGVILVLAECAVAGAAIGGLAGWLVSLITGGGPKGVLKDALLGSFGFLVGLIGCTVLPWPRNTISYQLENGTPVTVTMNRFQHPWRVAVILAILLPFLLELYRRRKQSNQAIYHQLDPEYPVATLTCCRSGA